MALADPQSITINTITTSMPRTSSGVNSGGFTSNDGTLRFSVSHTYGKRTRRAVRLDHKKIAPDPFIAGQSAEVSTSVTLVLDSPTTGYTVTELKQVIDGFIAKLSASSGALITQIEGGES